MMRKWINGVGVTGSVNGDHFKHGLQGFVSRRTRRLTQTTDVHGHRSAAYTTHMGAQHEAVTHGHRHAEVDTAHCSHHHFTLCSVAGGEESRLGQPTQCLTRKQSVMVVGMGWQNHCMHLGASVEACHNSQFTQNMDPAPVLKGRIHANEKFNNCEFCEFVN